MAENKTVWLEDALAAAKTVEERDQILKDWEAQKVAEAARREEAMLAHAVEKSERRHQKVKENTQKFKDATQTLKFKAKRVWGNIKQFFSVKTR